MSKASDNSAIQSVVAEVLGYLNYSSGTSDPKFLANLNKLFELLEQADQENAASHPFSAPQPDTWREVERILRDALPQLRVTNPAFKDTAQVDAVLQLVWSEVLPAYLRHHSDLLFHQQPATLFRPFFIGRACEAVLVEGGPWDETERIVNGALNRLNDFIGYRPLPVLHNHRKHDPYPHERCRPVPLYIAGAGVAAGRYHDLMNRALEILNSLDEHLLSSAWFDPKLLDELAFDPRAYDFNHPVNKRPNYHFGLWDPHIIDQRGYYRRFVLQQTLLEALLERIETQQNEIPREELLEESAVVLVGTILMASGTSGNGPECHDSSVTLAKLMPTIAKYRDEYYGAIMQRMSGPHAQRLQKEMGSLKQPFAGARQHLNSQLARRRALQMQHVHLALLFARLGYAESALKQADIIPAVSARMTCQLYCHLTSGWHAAQAGQIAKAAEYVPQIESLLKRAINCGAVVDPWSILGFGGQFTLFPAIENSIPDLRVDELLDLMEQVFALAARVWHLAAVTDDQKLCEKISKTFERLTDWWDPFATTSVEGIKSVSGREAFAAAKRVAEALQAWHRAGAAAGKIGFWREHAEQFDSPQAFARVIEALLEKQDLASSAGLIMHWLGEADRLPLEEGLFSYHQLTQQWILQLFKSVGPIESVTEKSDLGTSVEKTPAVIVLKDKSLEPESTTPTPKLNYTLAKFFDQLEANADTFWEVPELNLDAVKTTDEKIADLFQPPDDDELDEDDDDEEGGNLFKAAYDEMVFRDSTADGIDSSLAESGETTDYELESESQRIITRLAFLATLTRLWMHTALASPLGSPELQLTEDHFRSWLDQARRNRKKLSLLAHAVVRQPLEPQSAEHEALVEYDRRRMIKESLLERVIATSVAMAEAELFLRSVLKPDQCETRKEGEEPEHWKPTVELWRALLHGEYNTARQLWPNFLNTIRSQPLLYVPLAKGGDPRRIASARDIQQTLRVLLSQLPHWGMLRETCQLIQTARVMERDHPLGPGAVTEFDRLFEIGFKSIIECLVESSRSWNLQPENGELADLQLIECIQQVTEALLSEWLSHSSTLRLSVLEKISNENEWRDLIAFVEKYGHDLFTQRFFNLGNLRGILHQGIDAWLHQWELTAQPNEDIPLLDDLENNTLLREDAIRHLQMVIESIVENFTEYRDYNATTTQSDRGEMVYMLLDFLRIKAGYERIHWNLRPVVMAHEVLVRADRVGAAELWRRTMADRTSDAADLHLKKLRQLQKKYGMRLPTIADRLAERFVRPLDIDRICALVSAAAEDAKYNRTESPAFEQLEYEAGELASAPSGAGLDLPDWMAALEEEVDHVCGPQHYDQNPFQIERLGPRVLLSWDEIQTQLTNWETKFLGNEVAGDDSDDGFGG